MNAVLDDMLVLFVLLASISYAALTLGPRTLRRALARWFLKRLARAPQALRRPALLSRLERVGAVSACGGCDSCGDGKAPAGESHEVKVPLATIGRRR